jgi:CSLREA domain-containing protein
MVVNSAVDQVDASPGNGVCATASGACTLRAAIQEANARPGADIITLPAGRYIISISGDDDTAAKGDLNIADTLTLKGAGAATTFVDGGGEHPTAVDRVLRVQPNVTATISGITVQYGAKSAGGGIYNQGALTLSQVSVVKNTADIGGGIQNYGTLTLLDSLVAGNLAHIGGGGINNDTLGAIIVRRSAISDNLVDGENIAFIGQGGGIANDGQATIEDSRLERNALRGDFTYGAGIDQTGGQLTLRDSRVALNVSAGFAQAWGGGISNRDGTLTISRSRIDSNAAADRRPNDPQPDGLGGGGGLYSNDPATLNVTDSSIDANITMSQDSTASGAGVLIDGGTATIARSAIYNNRSARDGGGVLALRGALTLINVTISGNQAARNGGGLLTRSQGAANLTNVTIASNTAGAAGAGLSNAGVTQLANTLIASGGNNCQLSSALISRGNNLESANTCGLRGAGDKVNQSPQLQPLVNNGGLTPTHAIPAGSPAVNTGNSQPAVCPTTDQRGAPRPAGGACDIGAYEAGSIPPLVVRARVYLPFIHQ